jgi:anti-sigma factor RsiW
MTRGTENDLMRLLHGELPAEEARELRARMWREPELAEDYRRLERTWSGLELPPAAPVPLGFTGRIMARVRGEKAAGSLSWASAPRWVRVTAAASLVAGALLGIGVGRSWPTEPALTHEGAIAGLKISSGEDLSLVKGYWGLLEEAMTTGGETEARQ